MSLAFIHLPENEYAPLARGLSALSRQHGSAKLAFPCAYHLHIHSHSTLPQHSFPRTHVGTNSSAEFTHLARCKETLGNSQPTCPARTLHRAERATISKSVNQPSRARTHTHTHSRLKGLTRVTKAKEEQAQSTISMNSITAASRVRTVHSQTVPLCQGAEGRCSYLCVCARVVMCQTT